MKYNISYSFKGSDIKDLVNKKILNIIKSLELLTKECDYDI